MKKSVKIILFTAAFVLLAAAIVLGLAVKKYLDEVPVITPKTRVYAEVGETLSITELADIEKAVSSRITTLIEWRGGGETNAEVRGGGQSLFVGNYTGYFDVTVEAVGKNSESRSAKVTVEVYVTDKN